MLTLATLGGLYFYRNSLDEQIADSGIQYTGKFGGFMDGSAKPVLDYQSRLLIATDLEKKSRSVMDDFSAIENAMVQGVYLGSYDYENEGGLITLSCYADNYEIIAKQILSFKASSAFSSVLAGESKYDTKMKKINFPVIIKIKNQNI
jgi:hypothetical protein